MSVGIPKKNADSNYSNRGYATTTLGLMAHIDYARPGLFRFTGAVAHEDGTA